MLFGPLVQRSAARQPFGQELVNEGAEHRTDMGSGNLNIDVRVARLADAPVHQAITLGINRGLAHGLGKFPSNDSRNLQVQFEV